MFIGGWKVTEDYDLRSFYHSAYSNPARYSNTQLDGYLDLMQTGLDNDKMTETLEKAKKIIEDDLIEGIIAMPTQLFYSVTIPVTLWFITKGKKQSGKTLFIDARKMGHMVDRKHRDFTEEDIQKLANTFEAFQNGTLEDEKGFCSVATIQDIAKQDYVLTPGRYVGIEEQVDDGEPFEEKMTRLTSELSDMFERSHELEDEIRRKLGAIGYEI